MRTLITIMAHKEAQDTFNRHFQHWFELGADMLIAYPKGSRVLIPTPKIKHEQQIMQLEVGKPAHSGIESIIRFRTILEQMAGMGYDRYAFFEYDALCFGPLPDKFGDIAGNVFRDNGPDRGFTGTMFVHPPLMFTQQGIDRIVREMQGMGLAAEGSVWDRWFGLCVERTGFPIYSFLESGEGISRNTFHAEDLPALKLAFRSGCRLVHGIKTPEALAICKDSHDLWQMKQELIKEEML